MALSNGLTLMQDPTRNKGTAFTDAERDALGLRGLLPARVTTIEVQARRVLAAVDRKPNDIEKYIYLMALQDRNETLFFRVVADELERLMPILYTPTVGQACLEYGHLFRRPRGLYVTKRDRGHVADILRNWPRRDVRVIVVTDGERILGLGDLGANGMGIPVGKLALYVACAGIHPGWCLPVMLDVGTNNETLRRDPLYLGIQEERLRGEAYDDLVEEFVDGVREQFPNAILQLEDFGNSNAFRILDKYRDRLATFDDDIQGTASVALAGLLSALRLTGGSLRDQRILFFGAGEAGIGIGELVTRALIADGLSEEQACGRLWFFDSKGLVVATRSDLNAHKRRFAQAHTNVADFATAVDSLRPTAIVGVAGAGRTFTRAVLESMGCHNERPIVFALSNPTSKAECTAEEAYACTGGRAIFASGTPFDPVIVGGRRWVPGQGNNAYIYPGVGLGLIASGARRVIDEMFFAAAEALAAEVAQEDLDMGRVYPPLSSVRRVSLRIACAVAEVAYEQALATVPRPLDLRAQVSALMYEPKYALPGTASLGPPLPLRTPVAGEPGPALVTRGPWHERDGDR
jgi:malate dehydrogenase (oxaloacetate-decarboxylating)(NADP+)